MPKRYFQNLLAGLVCLTVGASTLRAETPSSKPAPAAEPVAPPSVVQKVTLTNKLVDGKKTWLPADVSVQHGAKVELTLINTLADPHGFTAPGLTSEPIVVQGNETKTVTLTAPGKPGTVKFSCQLHPAHVGGSITVQ